MLVLGGLGRAALAQPVTDPPPDPPASDTPPDSPARPAVTPAPSDDVDLRSLDLEPGGDGFDDKLNIYGFADMFFLMSRWRTKNPLLVDSKSFGIANLNFYAAKNLSPRARALTEVRFTFLPNGHVNLDGSFVDTNVWDLGNFYRQAQWGGVVIERAHLDYDLTGHLTLRAGHWLTPYGIWNTDHGSPTIIGIGKPYIVGEQFFPEHQTGLDLIGNHLWSGFVLNYHATVSNGRGAAEAQVDFDTRFAFGGRVELKTPWGLKLGASYYRGRYSGFPRSAYSEVSTAPTYFEAAYGGDIQLVRGNLHVQAELLAHDRHYPVGQRPLSGFPGVFLADGRDVGFYVLAGYRFEHLWSVMPFFEYEDYRVSERSVAPRLSDENLGLNFRPTPNVVFKLQAVRVTFDRGEGALAGNRVYYLSTQASWAF